MIVKTFTAGPLKEHPYLAIDEDSKEAIIIDPGGASEEIIDEAGKLGAKVKYIINTHFHPDHIAENAILSDMTGAPITIHQKDAPMLGGKFENFARKYQMTILGGMPGKILKGGERMKIGRTEFEIIHVPGHTPGAICIFFPKEAVIFTGDTLFANAIGRTDLSESLPQDMITSLQKLLDLPDNVTVYPGHGRQTSIGDERGFVGKLTGI